MVLHLQRYEDAYLFPLSVCYFYMSIFTKNNKQTNKHKHKHTNKNQTISEILWNARFVSIVKQDPRTGKYVIDFNRFSDVILMDDPQQQQHEREGTWDFADTKQKGRRELDDLFAT